MIEFKSLERYEITDRGTVLVVELDKDYTINELLGEEVIIDQSIYHIIGVETMGINSLRKGIKTGLMVKFIKSKNE